MLVFGPSHCIPSDSNFVVYNLSSQNERIQRLPGLFVYPNFSAFDPHQDQEKQFDIWYYDYVMNDLTACSSLMLLLNSIYDGEDVYVCISEYKTTSVASIINESFMKMIQTRYDIDYSIINEPEDLNYIRRDGCVFMSVMGIQNFDADRKRFMQLMTEEQIRQGNMGMMM